MAKDELSDLFKCVDVLFRASPGVGKGGLRRSGPAGQCATGVLVQAGPCGSAPHPGGMTDEPSSMTGVRVTLVIAEIVGVSHGS